MKWRPFWVLILNILLSNKEMALKLTVRGLFKGLLPISSLLELQTIACYPKTWKSTCELGWQHSLGFHSLIFSAQQQKWSRSDFGSIVTRKPTTLLSKNASTELLWRTRAHETCCKLKFLYAHSSKKLSCSLGTWICFGSEIRAKNAAN